MRETLHLSAELFDIFQISGCGEGIGIDRPADRLAFETDFVAQCFPAGHPDTGMRIEIVVHVDFIDDLEL